MDKSLNLCHNEKKYLKVNIVTVAAAESEC